MKARLAAVRDVWRMALNRLKAAPITEAQRIADEIRADLDRHFPKAGGS